MARKTKHEAQLTRHRILDAAERAFEQHGVSGTSLDDIARAAGLTRGAIYWHFQGKADLFNAMMARVVMPWEDPAGGPAHTARDLTLDQLRDHLVAMLRQFVDDPQRRRVFDILLHKVDHVGEMQAVRQRHLEVRQACWVCRDRRHRRAVLQGQSGPGGRLVVCPPAGGDGLSVWT